MRYTTLKLTSLLIGGVLSTHAIASEDSANINAYGSLRVDAISTDGVFNNTQSPSFLLNAPAGRNPGDTFTIHPRLTRLGVDVEDHEIEEDIDIGGKVEIDFQNGGRESRPLLRIRHAYFEVKNNNFKVLVGQTWQTVSRLIPIVNGDTLQWNAGNAGDRAPQIRLTYEQAVAKDGAIDFELAFQQIGSVDNKGQVGVNFGPSPAIEARVQYEQPLWTAKPFLAALGAHKATEVLAERSVQFEDTYNSEGIFAELVLPLTEDLTLSGEYFKGENLTDLRGGILFGINETRGIPIRTEGYWSELAYQVTDKLQLSTGLSEDNPFDEDILVSTPTLNKTEWGTAHYSLTKRFLMGVEYIHWTTDFQNAAHLTANRYNLFGKFSF